LEGVSDSLDLAKPEQSIANYGGYRKLRRMSVLCISPRLAAEVETLHNSDLADLIEQKAAAATEMCAWGKERMWRTGALLEEVISAKADLLAASPRAPMTRRIGPDYDFRWDGFGTSASHEGIHPSRYPTVPNPLIPPMKNLSCHLWDVPPVPKKSRIHRILTRFGKQSVPRDVRHSSTLPKHSSGCRETTSGTCVECDQ
jgi:hypothetical protein